MPQPRPMQLLAFASLCLATAFGGATSAAPFQEADLVLTHGAIYTPTGWAQALAIRSGVIVVIGEESAVEPYKSSKTPPDRPRRRRGTAGAARYACASPGGRAIDLFTVNSAREIGNGNKAGSLERGLLADLIVLDRNPLKIPVTQIRDTRVKMTLVNGEIVYRLPNP